jgi:urease accessory protein
MLNQKIHRSLAVFIMLLLAVTPAWAHPSHEHAGWWAGLLHPVSGVDHVLAMFGIGLWVRSRRIVFNRRQVPLLAAACLAGLAFFSIVFAALPSASLEWLLAGSVLAVGLLVLFAAKLSLTAMTLLAVFLMAGHVYAHFVEMPAVLQAGIYASAGYVSGFAVTTAVLLSSGAITAWSFERLSAARGLRVTGGVLTACGLLLLNAV